MADNFLERQRQDYEARKTVWLKNKKHLTKYEKGVSQSEMHPFLILL